MLSRTASAMTRFIFMMRINELLMFEFVVSSICGRVERRGVPDGTPNSSTSPYFAWLSAWLHVAVPSKHSAAMRIVPYVVQFFLSRISSSQAATDWLRVNDL